MKEQMIIALSREYGSGGHNIAKIIAERFGLSYYDRNMLDEVAKHKEVDVDNLHKYDEAPKKTFLSRTVRGHSNSPEEAIANFQFEYLKHKAESGESFIVVGRCAEYVLKEYPGLITIFVLGDRDVKLKRIEETRNVSEDEAVRIMMRHDKKRKAYHNYYCPNKWGDSRGYDITINSSKLGFEKTADVLEKYIRMRLEK